MKIYAADWSAMTPDERKKAWESMSESEREELQTHLDMLERLAGPKDSGSSELKIQPPSVFIQEELPEQKTLATIRGKTCYPQLRFLIDIAFYGVLIALAIMGLTGTAGMRELLDVAGVTILWLTISGLAFIAIAGRQALLLLVDIADTQIHRATGKPDDVR